MRGRAIVLDVIRRDVGSGGVVHAGQARWLAQRLQAAGSRWVIVFSHAPLERVAGGARLLALLDRDPHVVAATAARTSNTPTSRIDREPAPSDKLTYAEARPEAVGPSTTRSRTTAVGNATTASTRAEAAKSLAISERPAPSARSTAIACRRSKAMSAS